MLGIVKKLQGYKTYIMAGGAIIVALVQLLNGEITFIDFILLLLGGGGLAGLAAKMNRVVKNVSLGESAPTGFDDPSES